MIIWAKDRNFVLKTKLHEEREKHYKDLTVKRIGGGHHVHMDEPELVFNLIIEFLNENKSKL